jgi:thioredoxin 1
LQSNGVNLKDDDRIGKPSFLVKRGRQLKILGTSYMERELEQAASREQGTNSENVAEDRIQSVTGDTFIQYVLQGEGPIAVEFMSYGCSYCRALEPAIQKVAEMIESKGKIFRVNVAVEQMLADTYNIQATPTLVMFLNGRNIGTVEGLSPTVSSVLTAVTHPFGVMK